MRALGLAIATGCIVMVTGDSRNSNVSISMREIVKQIDLASGKPRLLLCIIEIVR